MRIERALAVRDRLKTRISDIYSMAAICAMTHADINAAVASARADVPKGTPQWVFSYADGFRAALQDRLYDSCLVYGGFVNGRFYSTHSNRPDYYEKHGIEPSAFADNGTVKGRGHYWRESIAWRGGSYNRDCVKPYFCEESGNGE